MAGFFVVMMGFLALATYGMGIIYIVSAYILEGVSLKAIYGWKAWIPCYSQYLWGELAGKRGLGVAAAILDVLWPAAGFCFLQQPELPILWGFAAVLVFRMAAKVSIAHQIYAKTVPQRKNLYTVLSVLTFGMLRPAFLFATKKFFRMFSKNT